MKKSIVHQIVLSGMFIALGFIVPQAFHLLGAGTTFLPMHIPVLLAGFILDAPFAAMVGFLTPMLSSFITGMPPLFPVLPFMVFELATYGFAASLFYRHLKQNIYVSLVGAMVAGRAMAGVAVWLLVAAFAAKLPGPVAFVLGSTVTGLPGIIIQLIFIPAVVALLNKYQLRGGEGKAIES